MRFEDIYHKHIDTKCMFGIEIFVFDDIHKFVEFIMDKTNPDLTYKIRESDSWFYVEDGIAIFTKGN